MKEPSPLRKILVPTDFSSTSFHALKYAAYLNQYLNSEITIFHVLDVPAMTSGEMVFVVDYAELEKEAIDQLEKAKREVLSIYKDAKISVNYTTGVAVHEILEKSSIDNFDLVVMGSNGSSGILETIFGSITKSVIANCTCPVLAIPLNVAMGKPEKVAFATNFDEHELQSLFLLAELLRPFDSEINILHIGEISDMKHQDELLNYFRGQVRSNIIYEKIHYHLEGNNAMDEAIEKFVVSHSMDWLALAKRKRNFFDLLTTKSLTNQIRQHSNIPLLVFHTKTKSGTPLF